MGLPAGADVMDIIRALQGDLGAEDRMISWEERLMKALITTEQVSTQRMEERRLDRKDRASTAEDIRNDRRRAMPDEEKMRRSEEAFEQQQ